MSGTLKGNAELREHSDSLECYATSYALSMSQKKEGFLGVLYHFYRSHSRLHCVYNVISVNIEGHLEEKCYYNLVFLFLETFLFSPLFRTEFRHLENNKMKIS